MISRRRFLGGTVALSGLGLAGIACGGDDGETAPAAANVAGAPRIKTLRFGVGPLLPTTEDTKKAYDPVFKHIASALNAENYDLVATTDWAGISVAMGSGNLDIAWMGPWGYVLANNATNCEAVATVKYDGKPVYHAIVVGNPELAVTKFPDDTRGMSISFADVGSTSGWLIPTWYAQEVWKIDPKKFWNYSEGATHAANEIAVASGQVQLATDFDRNRNAMLEGGKLKAGATKVIWTSDPLPNDAIAVRKDFDAGLRSELVKALLAITEAEAGMLLPPHYTGFVAAGHSDYRTIEDAGIAVGRLKKS